MEIIRIVWVVVLLFFMLILFFAWSKMYLIGKKLDALTALIRKSDELDASAKEPVTAVQTPSVTAGAKRP
jgi:hypothetical protein